MRKLCSKAGRGSRKLRISLRPRFVLRGLGDGWIKSPISRSGRRQQNRIGARIAVSRFGRSERWARMLESVWPHYGEFYVG